MATVLLAWELGEGLSHVWPLLVVARALAAEGHQPVFAVRNLADTGPLFADEPFAVLQAPVWHPRRWRHSRPFVAASFADVLALNGYDHADNLLPRVLAWQRLLDLVQPRLLVSEYSPTLCLAAYGTLPRVLIGSWFALPPSDGDCFPALTPGQEPLLPQEQVLAVVQEVQRRRGRRAPPTLPALLGGDRFVCVLPELDPYQPFRREPYWDPPTPLPPPAPPEPGPGFFAYLSAEHAAAEAVLTSLALTGLPGTVYLGSAPEPVKAALRLQGLEVLDRPANLADVLARAAVVVHHGGIGTAQAALGAGRPQLLLPSHLEQQANARTLQQLGVAAVVAGKFPAESAARSLGELCSDRRFDQQARALAVALQNRARRDSYPAVLECCRRYLG